MSNKSRESTYPLRAAARLTGLSPELLRAWERRYRAVEPQRTEGGTRRYRASDLDRLRLLKAAVDAGHRIGGVASLPTSELEALGQAAVPPTLGAREAMFAALEAYDGAEVRRLLSQQLMGLGPVSFARDFAVPLAHEIGERWAAGRLSVASEHLASTTLRSLLGAALTPASAAGRGPKVVFATLDGERHELGLQIAALVAMGAGANPVYLGAEVPVEDLLRVVEELEAQVLALSVVGQTSDATQSALATLRRGLPERVRLWVGGAGSASVDPIDGIEIMPRLEDLEQRVALLDFEGDLD